MIADITRILKQDAAVNALIDGRVTWGENPQGAILPRVRVTLVNSSPVYVFGDNSQKWRDALVQFDCYADTYMGADALRKAVVTALSEKQTGSLEAVFERDCRSILESEETAGKRIFGFSIDFDVKYKE